MGKLPAKTVERLSEYRRTLINCMNHGKEYIYSHELAQFHHKTAVQVRRDIMLMGFSGVQRKGYKVKEMIDAIGRILDYKNGQNVGIVGIGHLGTAILQYFTGKRPKLRVVAIFDVDEKKTGREINGVHCYHVDTIPEVVERENIDLGIITVPPEFAKETAEGLINAGIRGILNFTTVPLNVPEDVYLEEYDMITSLEKVAYFARG
ncbi:MAG: redox-sensing transcriptional repressor Rex [Bacteroidales bacterium]|nr:redox-sensing transcriptional repressor Rex [Bacteroidales bacterium]